MAKLLGPQTDTQSWLELVLITGDGGEAPFPIEAAGKYPAVPSHALHAALHAGGAKADCGGISAQRLRLRSVLV
jgi:hypothetical protein